MKKIITIVLLLPLFATAQNTFKAAIKNDDTKEPIQGATVQIQSLHLSGIANDSGVIVLHNIPKGKYDVEITSIGYKDIEKTYTFPLLSIDTIQLFMDAEACELADIKDFKYKNRQKHWQYTHESRSDRSR